MSYVGRYRLRATRVIDVTMQDGRLSFRTSPEAPERELIPMSRNRFFSMGGEAQYVFTINEAGEVVDLTLDHGPYGLRKAARIR